MNETLQMDALQISADMLGLDPTTTEKYISWYRERLNGTTGAIPYLADFAYRTALKALEYSQPQVVGRVLGVPFVPQVGPHASLASGDCGPACVAMCTRFFRKSEPWVDDLVREMGAEKRFTTSADLIPALTRRGMSCVNHGEFDKVNGPLTPLLIEDALQFGLPLIALVDYATLRPEADYKGLHWVVIVGEDQEKIMLHDPLFAGLRGLWLPKAVMWQALQNTKRHNAQAWHGIVVGP